MHVGGDKTSTCHHAPPSFQPLVRQHRHHLCRTRSAATRVASSRVSGQHTRVLVARVPGRRNKSRQVRTATLLPHHTIKHRVRHRRFACVWPPHAACKTAYSVHRSLPRRRYSAVEQNGQPAALGTPDHPQASSGCDRALLRRASTRRATNDPLCDAAATGHEIATLWVAVQVENFRASLPSSC